MTDDFSPAGLASKNPGAFSALGQKVLETTQYLLAPWIESKSIRKKADAKAFEVIALANAKARATTIEQRTAQRLLVQEIRHQHNIESIIAKAAHEPAEVVSPEPVDQDWVHRFFRGCEDVSDPRMQSVFAKLFAGEVAQPGTFSRRAISLVQEMSTRDANLADKASSLYWFIEPPTAGAFIPRIVVDRLPHLLNLDEAITLGDMGILHSEIGLGATPPAGSIVRYGSHRFAVREQPRATIPAFNVTKPAQELHRVLSRQEHSEYLDESLAHFKGRFAVLESLAAL